MIAQCIVRIKWKIKKPPEKGGFFLFSRARGATFLVPFIIKHSPKNVNSLATFFLPIYYARRFFSPRNGHPVSAFCICKLFVNWPKNAFDLLIFEILYNIIIKGKISGVFIQKILFFIISVKRGEAMAEYAKTLFSDFLSVKSIINYSSAILRATSLFIIH